MFIDASDPVAQNGTWNTNDPTIVAEFYIVAVQDLLKFQSTEGGQNPYDGNLAAYKCTSKMCLQRFRTTMRNSTTTTTMTKSQDSSEIAFGTDHQNINGTGSPVLNVGDPKDREPLWISQDAINKLLGYLAYATVPGKATVTTGVLGDTFSSDSARGFNTSLYQNTPTVHQHGLEDRLNLLATSLSNAYGTLPTL